jgi:hypothetical protein
MPLEAMPTGDDEIFNFERDFAGTLHCIPMIVRLKLDLCGIKLSLRQWNRFTLEDRRGLVTRPCRVPEDIAAWRAFLVRLIHLRTREEAVALPVVPGPPWDDCDVVPGPIIDRSKALGLAAPNAIIWAALTQLQRFTLIKLTSGGHDNDNFGPALREFGILGDS